MNYRGVVSMHLLATEKRSVQETRNDAEDKRLRTTVLMADFSKSGRLSQNCEQVAA